MDRADEFSTYLSLWFMTLLTSILKYILGSWSINKCYEWLTQEIGLDLEQEIDSNKWFPKSNSAREVRDSLQRKAESLGVEFKYNTKIQHILKEGNRWHCTIENTDSNNIKHFSSDKVIVATGGLSYPKVGTDGTGHKFLQQIGHSINDTFPALTPLIGNHPGFGCQLAGISLNVHLTLVQQFFKENNKVKKKRMESKRQGFLFTHRGYSGPAILDMSHLMVNHLDEKP